MNLKRNKNFCVSIFVFIVFMILLTPVGARAGGGSSSGGGGGSSHTSSHRSRRSSGNGSPIAGVIGIGACMGMIVYWKRKKARHMHQEIKDDLYDEMKGDIINDLVRNINDDNNEDRR